MTTYKAADGTGMTDGDKVESAETPPGETTLMILSIKKPPKGYRLTTTCSPGPSM
jgi:hypothetical protein